MPEGSLLVWFVELIQSQTGLAIWLNKCWQTSIPPKYKHQGVTPLPQDACQTTPQLRPYPSITPINSRAAHTNSQQCREGTL